MMMLLIPIAFSEILFTLEQNSFQAILRWFLLGFHFIGVALPCFLVVCLVEACKNLSLIKDAFVFCLKIGVMPWIIGWWLKICTSSMFGTTLYESFEIFSDFTWLIFLQWVVGLFCLINAETYREVIQEIIHKRAFWYLLDVTDPDYKITKLFLGSTFFAFAFHGSLLVISFHLPIKAIKLISPSFFPLELWVADERFLFGAYAVYLNLMVYGPRWLIKVTTPAIEFIVRNWIVTVSSWLQLSDFLLVVPRGEGFQRAVQNVIPRQSHNENIWFLLYSLAEGSMVSLYGLQNVEDGIKDQRDKRFMLRIALMLVLAALSLFLFSTNFIALPILVGRVFFDSISFVLLRYGLKHDDFSGFWIGCYILRAIYLGTCFVFDHIQKGRINLLFKYVLNGLMFSIWISVIPGLLGRLINLMVIIPYRVPLHESTVYFLIQDWFIVLVVLHIWTFMTMLTPINWFATDAWRKKLERIRNAGINGLPSMWLLQDVLGSILCTLLATLLIPYLVVISLFPLLGYSHAAVERFICPTLLVLIVVWFVAKVTRDIIIYLHQLVFNEKYLVGERVDNFTEGLEH